MSLPLPQRASIASKHKRGEQAQRTRQLISRMRRHSDDKCKAACGTRLGSPTTTGRYDRGRLSPASIRSARPTALAPERMSPPVTRRESRWPDSERRSEKLGATGRADVAAASGERTETIRQG